MSVALVTTRVRTVVGATPRPATSSPPSASSRPSPSRLPFSSLWSSPWCRRCDRRHANLRRALHAYPRGAYVWFCGYAHVAFNTITTAAAEVRPCSLRHATVTAAASVLVVMADPVTAATAPQPCMYITLALSHAFAPPPVLRSAPCRRHSEATRGDLSVVGRLGVAVVVGGRAFHPSDVVSSFAPPTPSICRGASRPGTPTTRSSSTRRWPCNSR